MNLKPLTNHIIIEPLQKQETTKSGIVLPSSDDQAPEQGIVKAVGSDQKIEVKVGDKVIINKFGPTEIKIDYNKYLIASQDDILAIIEE